MKNGVKITKDLGEVISRKGSQITGERRETREKELVCDAAEFWSISSFFGTVQEPCILDPVHFNTLDWSSHCNMRGSIGVGVSHAILTS
jgi:hypothetical protein